MNINFCRQRISTSGHKPHHFVGEARRSRFGVPYLWHRFWKTESRQGGHWTPSTMKSLNMPSNWKGLAFSLGGFRGSRLMSILCPSIRHALGVIRLGEMEMKRKDWLRYELLLLGTSNVPLMKWFSEKMFTIKRHAQQVFLHCCSSDQYFSHRDLFIFSDRKLIREVCWII